MKHYYDDFVTAARTQIDIVTYLLTLFIGVLTTK